MEEQTPYFWMEFYNQNHLSENVIIVGDDNLIIMAQIKAHGRKKHIIGKYNITNQIGIINYNGKQYFTKKFKYLCLNEDFEVNWITLNNGKVPHTDEYHGSDMVSGDYVGRAIDSNGNYIPGRISIKDMCMYWDNHGKESRAKVYEGIVFAKKMKKDQVGPLADEQIAEENKLKHVNNDNLVVSYGHDKIPFKKEDKIDNKMMNNMRLKKEDEMRLKKEDQMLVKKEDEIPLTKEDGIDNKTVIKIPWKKEDELDSKTIDKIPLKKEDEIDNITINKMPWKKEDELGSKTIEKMPISTNESILNTDEKIQDEVEIKIEGDLEIKVNAISNNKELLASNSTRNSNSKMIENETCKVVPSMEINSLSFTNTDRKEPITQMTLATDSLPKFQEPIQRDRVCCVRMCVIF